jgi:hypothetical protein
MKAKKKQKQVSIEEYIETYCQEKRIRERLAVYVSPQTHDRLKSIARLFAGKHHTTASSIADSIISCHFEEHKELLNDVQKEDRRELLEWLEGMKRYGNEEQS